MTMSPPNWFERSGPFLLAVLMGLQALWGLLTPGIYRDVDWITVAWRGNDLVTLCLVVPVLLAGLLWWQRVANPKAAILILAGLSFAVYNGLFYLLGATLNAAFPLYVAIVLVGAVSLAATVTGSIGRTLCRASLTGWFPRLAGVGLGLIGFGLGAVWLSFWVSAVLMGGEFPSEEPVFRLVAALDLTIIAPLLITGGAFASTASATAALVAPMAALFGVFYLSVLSLNGVLLIRAGLAEAPGELPIWLPILAALLVISATFWVTLDGIAVS